MAGQTTICSSDDHLAALRKLHWNLVPEFLVLTGKEEKNRVRNYSLVLSEAEFGHIETLCTTHVPARKSRRQKPAARKVFKRNRQSNRKAAGR